MSGAGRGPVRIGVLGCAEIARRRLLPAIAAGPDTTLVAVASRDARRAERTAAPYGCRAVHGYEALLADAEVEAVYVPLPAALHERWVAAALDAGKHVLGEKPLALDASGARRLFARAGKLGLALMENVMFLRHGQHEAVRKAVADAAIGQLRAFRAEFTVPARPPGDIRLRPQLGGGALRDTGVYPVRAALHLLGPRLSVVGAHLGLDERYGVDTAGAALLRTPEGVTAHLAFGLDHGYRSAYELTGEHGRITLDHAFTPRADHAPRLRLERAWGDEELVLEPEDQVAASVAAFAAAVRAGAAPGAEETVRQLELLDNIARAAGS
ncbi:MULTISPECIES: Gfo/Idh/MocA family protein [unclassified Streptomyces]|uniref:Gfo/Idh/MocA family protein n=1 Tax=unclassified Streptomyces TaxID=2593676 RepID=UPI00278BD4EA|nr:MULTISPECIES: Gfo/Idh/MocA family oxidoreductase [unclassified Streptomyces]